MNRSISTLLACSLIAMLAIGGCSGKAKSGKDKTKDKAGTKDSAGKDKTTKDKTSKDKGAAKDGKDKATPKQIPTTSTKFQ